MADPLERVRRFGEAYVRFGLTHPDEYRLVFLDANIPEAIRKVGHRAPTDDPTKPGVGGALVFKRLVAILVELEASGTKLNYPPDTCGELCWMGLHGLVSAFILKPEFPWSDRELLIKGMLEIHLKGILLRAPTSPNRYARRVIALPNSDDPTRPGVWWRAWLLAAGGVPLRAEASGTKLNYPPEYSRRTVLDGHPRDSWRRRRRRPEFPRPDLASC